MRGNHAFIQLRHFAAALETGTTDRTECPWCGGGSDKEPAFAVTRTSEAEALYKCHRASCGRAGRLAVWGFRLRELPANVDQISGGSSEKGKSFTPRLYTGDTSELGESWIAELLDLYGLDFLEANRTGWREELGTGLLVVPVLSPLGMVRGVELRRSKVQIYDVKGSKTDSYRFLEGNWLGWYRAINSGPTILVEDAISALKVSRHFQVVCLHGSHVSLDMLLEIIGIVGNSEIILALDEDATSKALKFVAEWRFIAPNFRCILLSKDMKYWSNKELLEIYHA